jgi:pyrroloquinoline quinone biosynthesis protein E
MSFIRNTAAGDDTRSALGDLPAPEPVPDMAAYLANRERALAADAAKRANFDRYMASGRRTADLDYLPIKLDLENVSRCNFRCTMCVVSDWPKGKRAADMPLAAFKRLIDEQIGLVEIKLQGTGEPTMQGDAYFEMIRYARSKHIWVRTTTNASLLHLRDNYRKLVDSGVNEIQISIDGADKATYEAVRRGGKFEMVSRNCRTINAYCAELGVLRTKMWTVVQRANRHQLPDIVRLAADLGFQRLVFSLELSDWGLAQWHEKNEQAAVNEGLDPAQLLGLVQLGEALGVVVRFWTVHEKYSTAAPDRICPWPFERAYVGSDLRVAPCCYIGNPDVYTFTPAPIESFTQTWNGPAMKAFRQAHIEGRIPAICAGCYGTAGLCRPRDRPLGRESAAAGPQSVAPQAYFPRATCGRNLQTCSPHRA